MKKSRFFSVLLFVSLLFVLLPATAKAIWDVPVGPGKSFRWVFVTSLSTNATSSDIETYNTFINDTVMAPLAGTPISGVVGKDYLGEIEWKAIASTEEVDAINNIGGPSSEPVYDPLGYPVAESTDAFFDGGIQYNGIEVTEYGFPSLYVFAWTGTTQNGLRNPGYVLGNDCITIGLVFGVSQQFFYENVPFTDGPYPLYAISEELTVPALIPAPGALMLATTGLFPTLGFMRLRRKHQE